MAIMVDLPITLKGVFIRIAKRTVIGQCGRMQFWIISIWVIFLAMGCGRTREPVPEKETNTKPSGGNATLSVKSPIKPEIWNPEAPITEAQLTAFGIERWSPYRGLAKTYLFSYLRQRRLASGDATPQQPG